MCEHKKKDAAIAEKYSPRTGGNEGILFQNVKKSTTNALKEFTG
jgi:hypothetical protein